MKNLLLIKKCLAACLLLLAFTSLNAQTTFWEDNFEGPASCVNNAGANWSIDGPLNTDNGILCNNAWAKGTAPGTCGGGNSLYITASGLFCDGESNEYLSDNISDLYALSGDISTVGVTGITLTFTWRNDGFNRGTAANDGTDKGYVGLSSDGGVNWTWLPTEYWKSEQCSTSTVTIPNTYEGKTNFRIGFRFKVNGTSCQGCDAPFNVDNIKLSAATTTNPVTPPAAPTVTSPVNVCPGDPLQLNATSTETGITGWQWTGPSYSSTTEDPLVTNSASNVHQGTYTVVVKRGGCTSDPTNVVVTVGAGGGGGSASSNSPVCTGDTLSLGVSVTGTGYSWSGPQGFTSAEQNPIRTGLTAQQAGTYTVTVTGGGCGGGTFSVTVTTNTSPVAPTLNTNPPGVDTICGGGSTNLCVSGTFTGYKWNTVPTAETTQCITVSVAGNYWLTVTDDKGCSAISQQLEINQYPATSVSIALNGFVLSTENISSSYEWFRNDTLIAGANQKTYTASRVGAYSVRIKDIYGCFLTSSKIGFGVGIDELDALHFDVFPNPASKSINIQLEDHNGKNTKLEIYSVVGSKVIEETLNFGYGNRAAIDISSLAKGIYMLQLQQNGKRPFTQKLVVE